MEEEKETDQTDHTITNTVTSPEKLQEDIFEAEFEFYDPDPEYYHATVKYLGNYLDSTPYNFSILADIITSQPGVGTMLGAQDSQIENSKIRQRKITDPKQNRLIFGFVTILPIRFYMVSSLRCWLTISRENSISLTSRS